MGQMGQWVHCLSNAHGVSVASPCDSCALFVDKLKAFAGKDFRLCALKHCTALYFSSRYKQPVKKPLPYFSANPCPERIIAKRALVSEMQKNFVGFKKRVYLSS